MNGDSVSQTHDEASWEAFKNRPLPEWYDAARLGIFVHWGPYSVAGWAEPIGELGTIDESRWYKHNPYAEWLFNTLRIDGSPAKEYFESAFPGKSYEDLLDLWEPPTVDLNSLMAGFKAAGAGYVVLTTKHHDGVTLWDSPDHDGRNTLVRGPKQDLVKSYADATRANGLKFGAYYSGGLDWHRRPFPALTTHDAVKNMRPIDAEYAKVAADHLRDLINQYQPDILWNDIDWPDAGKNFEPDGIGTVFQEYYKAVPTGLVNNRWHVPHADYLTSEYQFMLDGEKGNAWENCRGIGFSFGYNQNEASASLDSAGVIRHLVDVTTRGGHLLLGVGPKADGHLPKFQVEVLKRMADWMKIGEDLLPHMGPAKLDINIQVLGDGFFRIGSNRKGTYLFVDGLGDSRQVTLQNDLDWELLSTEFAELDTQGDSLQVTLSPNRPGAAILRLIEN